MGGRPRTVGRGSGPKTAATRGGRGGAVATDGARRCVRLPDAMGAHST